MSLQPLTTLFDQARQGGYALGYFEAWDSYSLEAVLAAAELENAPVILGFGCMMLDSAWLNDGGVELLGALGRAVAVRAKVPVSLMLNEAQTVAFARRAMDAGFNAIMVDTSAWDTPRAMAAIAQLTRDAHARGVSVEAELGRLPDAVGEAIDDAHAALTDPEQAARFVGETGVDCLAVSIGNVHLLTNGYAPVDMTQLEKIHARVSVPLVIHGGTSFPPHEVSRAIAAGALKFNVGTILKKTYFEELRATIQALPVAPNVHDLMGSHKTPDLMNAAQNRLIDKVRELIRLYRQHPY